MLTVYPQHRTYNTWQSCYAPTDKSFLIKLSIIMVTSILTRALLMSQEQTFFSAEFNTSKYCPEIFPPANQYIWLWKSTKSLFYMLVQGWPCLKEARDLLVSLLRTSSLIMLSALISNQHFHRGKGYLSSVSMTTGLKQLFFKITVGLLHCTVAVHITSESIMNCQNVKK